VSGNYGVDSGEDGKHDDYFQVEGQEADEARSVNVVVEEDGEEFMEAPDARNQEVH
jgi:hypothetical protein